jgi:SAM-dependent methyltransferase
MTEAIMQATERAASATLESSLSTSAAVLARPSFRFSDIWKAPLHDMPIRDEILYQYMPLSPDHSLLEVGPGSGFTAFRLARQVRRLTLLDVGPVQVQQLRQALDGRPNVTLVCADICRPGLRELVEGPFDAAFAIEVLELLPDPAACLRNLAELLRPQATLMLQFPNYAPPLKYGVCYFATRRQLDEMFEAAGFRSWQVWSLRLRPFAHAVFKELHERPLNLYRRLRRSNGMQGRLDYESMWAFRQRHRLEPYKCVLHAGWEVLLASARLNGPCFERTLLREEILGRNLLVMAVR